MQNFDVYFVGELLPGADPAKARRDVAALFKIAEEAADRLFSGKAVRIKQNADADAAGRYRALFRDAGALIRIVPAGSPPPAATPGPDAPPAPAQAAGGEARPASGISLAAPGATIDETPLPPPADIDTSALSALPANSGSLEDCHVEKVPYPIPDISHLKIVDN
ncbi:MAG: hypothetical protein KDJ39_07805 [Gammaproteobacteria bacterium]|nr:hypothetical protein [Gammaproteobacteria bacterium]MCP5298750.1 hypothetical protein [Chromatiaceae bacterium]